MYAEGRVSDMCYHSKELPTGDLHINFPICIEMEQLEDFTARGREKEIEKLLTV